MIDWDNLARLYQFEKANIEKKFITKENLASHHMTWYLETYRAKCTKQNRNKDISLVSLGLQSSKCCTYIRITTSGFTEGYDYSKNGMNNKYILFKNDFFFFLRNMFCRNLSSQTKPQGINIRLYVITSDNL